MSPTSSSQQQHTGLGKVNRSPPTHQLLSVSQYILIRCSVYVRKLLGESARTAETMPVSRLLASPEEVGVDADALEQLFAAGQREVDEGRAQGN